MPRSYTARVPSDRPRIQVTEDRELRAALRAARHLVGEEPEGARRQELLERLAARLEDPDRSGIDLDLLRVRNSLQIGTFG